MHRLGKDQHNDHTYQRTHSDPDHILRSRIRPQGLWRGKQDPNDQVKDKHKNHSINDQPRNMQQTTIQEEVIVHKKSKYITGKHDDQKKVNT